MPEINIIAIIVAGLIPNIIGALYYGPIMGKPWMASMGKTKEEMKPSNEALVYGSALVLGLMIAFILNFNIAAIHKDVNDAGELVFASFHTFGHGALHGAMISIGIVSPIIISLGLFHKTNGKTIAINVLFWTICLAIMGGILDVWQ